MWIFSLLFPHIVLSSSHNMEREIYHSSHFVSTQNVDFLFTFSTYRVII
nr:MAG TPA: hypothetical protein [Caudoviricetes sp.]